MRTIETEYNGYRFRSRLEARWAVFFDKMGIKYEYEPEGYVLDNGLKYLPDFRIYVKTHPTSTKPWPLYVEVKGEMTQRDLEKIVGLHEQFGVLVVGEIPKDTQDAHDKCEESNCIYHSWRFILDDWWPLHFSKCHGVPCISGPDYPEGWDGGAAQEEAFKAARYARFEHGESGYDN